MEYKRFGNKIIVRIDKDEEILEQVKKLALKENIRLAAVQALGATNSFTVGVYNVVEKQYYANSFSGSFEIVSLTGTINTMNGEFYTHLHMSAGNDKGEVFGGHLNRAVVSATCEMVVDVPADVYTVPYAVKMILEAKKRRDAGESLVLPRVDAKKGGAATC